MYEVSVTNHYPLPAKVGSTTIKTGESKGFKPNKGIVILEIPGIGELTCIDVGTKDIGGASKKKYGVLISLNGDELIFRFDSSLGIFGFAISDIGQITTINGNGDFGRIKLPTFNF